MAAATTSFNRNDILRAWSIFRLPEEVTELRVPKAGRYKTISGYFDDPVKMVNAVIGLADEPFTGIYFTINPVKSDLLARAVNKYVKYADTTTSDKEITALHWLPVDLDAKRPAGISSTNEEHEAAISKAKEIKGWLIEEQGWPAGAFVLGDSGNGGHLNVRIDLSNTSDNVALVKSCLDTLDFIFTDGKTEVDTTSQNPARIWKLYGTMVRKGDSTADRPHRLSKLLEVPDTIETVTEDQLKALATLLPKQEQDDKHKTTTTGKGFDPVAYCQAHNIRVHHTKSYNGGTLAVLEECVFNSDHHLSAVIIGWPNGARTYRCRHHSCLEKHWKEAKAVIEPNRAERKPTNTVLTLEQLTKATGKMVMIDPDTGDPIKDCDGVTILVPKRTLSPSRIATVMTDQMDLCVSEQDIGEIPKIWRYNGRIWKPDAERVIRKTVYPVLADLAYDRGFREALHNIRARVDSVTFDSDPFLFPALDGVIDLRTGEFRDSQPDDHLTFQYGAAYNNPNADCRIFLWALCSALPDPRDVLTVLDIITAIAIRVPFEVIVLLFGRGNNGKGLLEKVIISLFTMARVTAIKLDEVKRSRFGPGALLNKDAWIVTEVESVNDAMSALKAEASGEMIDSDVKHSARVQGVPNALAVIDSNVPLNITDNTYGRKRRFLKLDWPITFGDEPGMRPIDRQLKDVKVVQPEVLSGIVRIIAARAPELVRTRKIYRRKGTEEQEDEFRRQQYSMATFFEMCVSDTWTKEEYPDGPQKLKTDDLYNEYLKYCKLFNVTTPTGKVPFGRYISEKYMVDSVSTTETAANGETKRYRYYPRLLLARSAALAYAEIKMSFADNDTTDNYRSTTDLLQIYKVVDSDTTDTTDKVLLRTIREIEAMYKFISSCKDEREITWENYLKSSVVSVVTDEKTNSSDPKDENSICSRSVVTSVVESPDAGASVVPTDSDPAIRPNEAETIHAELERAQAEDADREHFKTPVVDKRHCALCGIRFTKLMSRTSYTSKRGYEGYICEPCRRDGGPEPERVPNVPQIDAAQRTLEGVGT